MSGENPYRREYAVEQKGPNALDALEQHLSEAAKLVRHIAPREYEPMHGSVDQTDYSEILRSLEGLKRRMTGNSRW